MVETPGRRVPVVLWVVSVGLLLRRAGARPAPLVVEPLHVGAVALLETLRS